MSNEAQAYGTVVNVSLWLNRSLIFFEICVDFGANRLFKKCQG